MFESGLTFEAISEGLELMRSYDERIAVAIRDATPRIRHLDPSEAVKALQQAVTAAYADDER
jgi:hypothetical protein